MPRKRHFGFFGSVSWLSLFTSRSSFMNKVLWSVEHWMLLVRRWQHWLAINYVELHCNSWPIRTGGQIFHRSHLCRPAFFSGFTYLSRNCSPQALAALFWETQTHPGFLVLCIINQQSTGIKRFLAACFNFFLHFFAKCSSEKFRNTSNVMRYNARLILAFILRKGTPHGKKNAYFGTSTRSPKIE